MIGGKPDVGDIQEAAKGADMRIFEIELLAGVLSSQKACQRIVFFENLYLHAAATHCIRVTNI
jgi:hypothetical protein